MALPLGTKSLREIRTYKDPIDQVRHLSTLLEYILYEISPHLRQAAVGATFWDLIEYHKDKFSSADELKFANRIRNRLTHPGRPLSPRDVDLAVSILNRATGEAIRYCSPDIRKVVRGADCAASRKAACCIECGQEFKVDAESLRLGRIVLCPECGAVLLTSNLDPIQFGLIEMPESDRHDWTLDYHQYLTCPSCNRDVGVDIGGLAEGDIVSCENCQAWATVKAVTPIDVQWTHPREDYDDAVDEQSEEDETHEDASEVAEDDDCTDCFDEGYSREIRQHLQRTTYCERCGVVESTRCHICDICSCSDRYFDHKRCLCVSCQHDMDAPRPRTILEEPGDGDRISDASESVGKLPKVPNRIFRAAPQSNQDDLAPAILRAFGDRIFVEGGRESRVEWACPFCDSETVMEGWDGDRLGLNYTFPCENCQAIGTIIAYDDEIPMSLFDPDDGTIRQSCVQAKVVVFEFSLTPPR